VPWVLGFAIAGHALGGDWESVRNGLEYVDYVLLAAIVLGVAYLLVRRKNARDARAEQAAPAEPAEPAARVGTPAD
jgi:membrane protein DedA with SNARE-associated domain